MSDYTLATKRELERALDHADKAIVRALDRIEAAKKPLYVELQRIRYARIGRKWKGD